ncbi:hypothetical protein [Deinococcus marmoris]|uniref:hypothetical protein n=1 Tax=Deinococcus marmoris TaxID=249408 RepID=UPI00096A31E2|nr:hypothetical protein [Deinococcus marmoris]
MIFPYLTTATRLERPSAVQILNSDQAVKLDAQVLACLSEHYTCGATAPDISMTLSRPATHVLHALARLQHEGRIAVVSGEGMTAVHCIPTHSRATAERVQREEIEEFLSDLGIKRRRVR